jgi:uncharacterized membrane protein YkoI
MKLELFDKVLLKTGEIAYIVEIYNDGEAYEADIDRKNGDIETETILPTDIERLVA